MSGSGGPLISGDSRLTMVAARSVQPYQLHPCSPRAQTARDALQGADGGDVPEMGVGDVDPDQSGRRCGVDRVRDRIGRGEEDLPDDGVGADRPVVAEGRGHAHQPGDLEGEEEAAQHHADTDAERQVVGGDDDADRREHHGGGEFRVAHHVA